MPATEASSTMRRVRYQDLREYLALLDQAGLLLRINAEVDLKDEIGAICAVSLDRDNGPALLFENIRGYPGKALAANIISTTEKLAIAFETEADDLEVLAAIHAGKANPIAPTVVESGPCQEMVHLGDDVSVSLIPTPWWHEGDGGQYIGTTAGVITADPDTGYLNCGMYRIMIVDKNTLTASIHGHPPHGGRMHILKHEALGRPAPIAIAIGMDPLLTYVAAQDVPSNTLENAEFSVVGGWRGQPVELVRCRTNDLLVPAHSEIVLEGEVLLNQRRTEGPHGETTGFYNSVDDAFVVRVNCITHRKNPINYGLICRPLEDYPKFLRSVGLRAQLTSVGIIKDVYVPDWGSGRIALVAAKVESDSDVDLVIEGVDNVRSESWIASKPRYLVILDERCDLRNWGEVIWRLGIAVRDQDIRVRPSVGPFGAVGGSSIVVDASLRQKDGVVWGPGGKAGELPHPSTLSSSLRRRVEARWRDYGFE